MNVEWGELFRFSVPPLELVVRGSLVYWFLFLIFRLLLRRDVGTIGIADVLVLVIIADAAQNGMAGGYESVSDAFVLIATIVAWNFGLDWAAYRSEAIRRVLQPPELLLVRDGRILERNLRKEMMAESDLLSKIREHGVEKLEEVKRAYMESDGTVTVIKRKPAADRPRDGDDGAKATPSASKRMP